MDDSYNDSKIPFSGNREVMQLVQGVSEEFKFFFDDALMLQIANKTNSYARAFINSKQDNLPPRSRVHEWQNFDSDELCTCYPSDAYGNYSETIIKNIFH